MANQSLDPVARLLAEEVTRRQLLRRASVAMAGLAGMGAVSHLSAIGGISPRPASAATLAVTNAVRIAPAHTDVPSPAGTFYGPVTVNFKYSGGTVMLASKSDGTGNIYTD